jgi:hypothetical protein
MPTFQLPLKVLLAFLELNKGSFKAGIGSDQERRITLIKVKGCTVGGLVGGYLDLWDWKAVIGCWCLVGETLIGSVPGLIMSHQNLFPLVSENDSLSPDGRIRKETDQ